MTESTTVDVYANAREHLLDELVRADLLLRRHLEAQWAGEDRSTDGVPGFYVSDEEVDRLLLTAQEAAASVRGDANPWVERPGQRDDEIAGHLESVTEIVRRRAARSIESGVDLRLISLAAEFGLSSLEVDALVLALAPDLDSSYETVYGYLRDDVTRTRPTVDLLSRVLTRSDVERLSVLNVFSRRSPLVREGLVRVEGGGTVPSDVVRVRKRILEHLFGGDAVATELDEIATVLEPDVTDAELYLDDESRDTLEEIAGRLDDAGRRRVPEWIAGEGRSESAPEGMEPDDGPLGNPDGSRPFDADATERRSLAAFVGPDVRTAELAVVRVCANAGLPILRVDGRALATGDLKRVLAVARREARLQSSAIYVTSVDALEPEAPAPTASQDQDEDALRASADRSTRLDRLVDALDAFPGDVFLSGNASLSATIQPRLDRHDFTGVAFPRPDFERRRALWASVDDLPSQADPVRLAGTFRLTRGGIEDAEETARVLSADELTAEAVLEACRMHSRRDLEGVAKPVEPTYGWADIVLPADALAHLREIAGAIRHRGTVFEVWGFADRFSLGNGINVLFTGKSGTGKTMAAEIVANDVGLPLYKLDLSSVLSKYIGETEKNLGRVFDAAEDSNAILFFDEADALFGKRTEISDSRDRYANVEVDYLLQRMEEHDGCVILASNLKENIDDAFRRRINATVDFPLPDEDARREIWELIFPAGTPTGEIDVEFLAGFELSGGDIKNVALTASFLAAEGGDDVGMDHVVRALHREFQKSGKLYDQETFGAYREALG